MISDYSKLSSGHYGFSCGLTSLALCGEALSADEDVMAGLARPSTRSMR
jgi:hypothetical protein